MFNFIFFALSLITIAPIGAIAMAAPLSLIVLFIVFVYIAKKVSAQMLPHLAVGAVGSAIAGFCVIGTWIGATHSVAGILQTVILFIISISATFFVLAYYIYILKKKKFVWHTNSGKAYLLIMYAIFLFVPAIVVWGYTDGIERSVTIEVGENPYIPGEMHNPSVRVPIWSYAYWTGSFTKSQEVEFVLDHKHARFIKHIGDQKAVGWSEEVVIYAFSMPDRVVVIEDGEKWLYNAWKEHPDWELPVYMKDGVLEKIGD